MSCVIVGLNSPYQYVYGEGSKRMGKCQIGWRRVQEDGYRADGGGSKRMGEAPRGRVQEGYWAEIRGGGYRGEM